MTIVPIGQGEGSPLVPRTEQAGLPDDLLRKTFEYLTAYEQRTMSLVSKGFAELAVMERPDLLKDLENFHKAVTEFLSNPLIEQTLEEVGNKLGIQIPAKEMIEQIRLLEGILASRLTREKKAEVLSIRLIAGKRNLSKEEAGIYKEILQRISEGVIECLFDLLPAHHKVIRQIKACQSALTSVPPPEQFQQWAREGKFELTKMLFDSMGQELQRDFGCNFARALLQEGDIETAHLVANSIPDPYWCTKIKVLWQVYHAYIMCGDLENAFEIAKKDFKTPYLGTDEGGDFVTIDRDFLDILEEFAVREQWDRVEEGIDILKTNEDKEVNYWALSDIAKSKWRQKENFVRAIKFIEKLDPLEHPRHTKRYRIASILREYILRHRDYEFARATIRNSFEPPDDPEKFVLQDIEIVSLLTEEKIEEVEKMVAAKKSEFMKDRGFSTMALFFAQQGNKEEAMRYQSQVKYNDLLRKDIERYLLEGR